MELKGPCDKNDVSRAFRLRQGVFLDFFVGAIIILFLIAPIYPTDFRYPFLSLFLRITGHGRFFLFKKTWIPVLSQIPFLNTPHTHADTQKSLKNGGLHHFLYLSTPVATINPFSFARFPTTGSSRCRRCCHSCLSVLFHRSVPLRRPPAAEHLRCLSFSRCRCTPKARYDGHVSSRLSCLILSIRPG